MRDSRFGDLSVGGVAWSGDHATTWSAAPLGLRGAVAYGSGPLRTRLFHVGPPGLGHKLKLELQRGGSPGLGGHKLKLELQRRQFQSLYGQIV